ncbi:MAG: hypothetical protein PHE87_10500, partial [Victivallaceae bacterium]|nr:hypothetical protein [Victivallaceae bacterium]
NAEPQLGPKKVTQAFLPVLHISIKPKAASASRITAQGRGPWDRGAPAPASKAPKRPVTTSA